MFVPNSYSFLLTQRQNTGSEFSSAEETTKTTSDQQSADQDPSKINDRNKRAFIPNSYSFLLTRRQNTGSEFLSAAETTKTTSDQQSADQNPSKINDRNKRAFIKAIGVVGAGVAAATLIPNKAQALILGSSPTTGVVGVKDSTNARINPATEETAASLLKTSDLTFDTGSLKVKVTSLPAAGSSSFSDSGDVAKSGLVDIDRHVQVDVLSSSLPSSASTETTLQTISFGGFKFTLRLATVGAIDYVGEAAIGTATSAASWRIKKIDSTSGIIIQWAGTGTFNQVWDNRADPDVIYS